MAKLNQVIAIEKGVKSRTYAELSELNKVVQKPDLFNGFVKIYQKKEEEAEDLPPEKKRVQFFANETLRQVERGLSDLMDVTARKDWTNCTAKADLIVDDKTILADVPVTYLLFLEKQLTDMRTFIGNIPILDEADNWNKDPNSGLYKAESTKTHRTKKVQRPIVLYQATPEHPAQTQMITEDVLVGYWEQVKQSGAMPKPERQILQERIEKLLRAVKAARESANMQDEALVPNVGSAVFDYLLDGIV